MKLLFSGVYCIVKVGGGLSCPVPVERWIRQGCPISGELYSIAIEPLLCRLRSRLKGLSMPQLTQSPPVVLVYADDVNMFIRGQTDVQALTEFLVLYEKTSSAKVNWLPQQN